MNIGFRYGFYGDNCLYKLDADLNVSVDYYKELKELLKIKKVKNYFLARVGNNDKDGGYIMVNDFLESGGIAYSFGINREYSWDAELAERGYDVYMYDHTIGGYSLTNDGFHFFKEGLGRNFQVTGPLNSVKNYVLRNLHKDKKNMILKIDTEGAEWDFLETVETSTLMQFDQIIMEVHGLVKACPEESWKNRLNLLRKLNETHQLIHLHANNSSYLLELGNSCFADVVEVTYALKDKYEFADVENLELPISSDYPNDAGRPDVVLGRWNDKLVV